MKKLLALLLALSMVLCLAACGSTTITSPTEDDGISAANGDVAANGDINVVSTTPPEGSTGDVAVADLSMDNAPFLLVWDGTEFDWATNRTISTTAGVTFTCSEGFVLYATSEVDGLFECCMPEPLDDNATCIITVSGEAAIPGETYTATFYGPNDEVLYETSEFSPNEVELPRSYEGHDIKYVEVRTADFFCWFDLTCG